MTSKILCILCVHRHVDTLIELLVMQLILYLTWVGQIKRLAYAKTKTLGHFDWYSSF